MRKSLFTIILAAFFSFILQAETPLITTGTDKSEEKARASALEQMSLTFSSRVQSSTDSKNSWTSSNAGGKQHNTSIKEMENRVLVTSDMPLFGVTFKTTDNGLTGKQKEYTVQAVLEPSKAIPVYKTEIKSQVEKINSRYKSLSSFSGEKEDSEWQLLSADYAYFDKLEMAFIILGGKNDVKPEVSSGDFRIQYERRAKEITSIEKAGEAVSKAILASRGAGCNSIYVYPPLFEGENTSTEFSLAVASSVKSSLSKNLALTKAGSDSYIKGSYYFAPGSVDGEDIVLSCYLCSSDGKVQASSGLIKIPYKVYSQYKFVPRSYDLNREIQSGRTSNPAFDVSIRVNGDRNGLEFREDDSLVIEVRATSSCYIYVLGYVYNDEGDPFTYLFPLEPYADGKEMFVRKISAKEANQWVVINPVIDNEVMNVQVIPPFGEETLQVFASTTDDFDDFVSKVPAYTETDDFYLAGGSPVSNVSKTRALNIKRVANKASKVVNTAESSVSYLTHK